MACNGKSKSELEKAKSACVSKGKKWNSKVCECRSEIESFVKEKAWPQFVKNIKNEVNKRKEAKRMEEVMNAPRGTKPMKYK